ncbi:class I SAM-dependent methyltransferase [Pedobacter xixiisoli]|uniref:Methyltransferase domain-containing protein n=1 Tax=Pedobacter xixiisoli TaxID=1476464 RepID=A0A286A994_9SPHI|nr:SAM-dependent methyltransferase [Pedobacter xixiisoli]SOD18476.1 Methyltransferase domain-containing protein [Pedobacter xixiisoli]
MSKQSDILFVAQLEESLNSSTFVKLALGNYKGKEEGLKQLYIKPVVIKNKKMLAFNFRYQTRDIFKNFSEEESLTLIKNYINEGFNIATLFTASEESILEKTVKGTFRLRTAALTQKKEVNLAHDKEKKRLILAKDNIYLKELGLTGADGVVFKNGQDKYKQINQYIEILSSLIKEFPVGTINNVVDMGSGKGYLTFALYDYLLNHQQKANVVGVEFRRDMVDLCNAIAGMASFDQLSFVEGTIDSYDNDQINLLIALHACDTATDDAIYKGIKANAELIVVAPCCHKQIRREIEKGKAKNELNFLTKHGIFLERQAEMVTDGLRALILEYFGYKTKVFEFVSDVHTPKNVLVVGIRNKEQGATNKDEILQKIKDTKAYFGIGYHHLERLFSL